MTDHVVKEQDHETTTFPIETRDHLMTAFPIEMKGHVTMTGKDLAQEREVTI